LVWPWRSTPTAWFTSTSATAWWRDSSPAQSDRYGHLVEGQRGFIAERRAKGVEPDKVAVAVEHALTARRPKPRYLIGPDAQATAVIGRLPDRLLVSLLRTNEA